MADLQTSDGSSHKQDDSPTNVTKDAASEKSGSGPQDTPSGIRLALIIAALMSSMLLVALDRTIIATAVPVISSHFHSIPDIGWYASSYLLTGSASQLIWGRLYKQYETKTLFLVSLAILLIGSAVCGAAPSSDSFIAGRAIAGLGSSGVFVGCTVVLTQVVPLHKRPLFVGLISATFGIAAIVGPLLGGAFTDKVSWRWCFYINLPIGAVVIPIVILFIRPSPTPPPPSLRRQLIRLDPLGTILFLPTIVCFLLALEWGSTTYSWDSGRIIALLVVSGVLLVGFIAVQIWRQEDATIPPRIIKKRNVACSVVFMSCLYGSMMSMLYSLPLWFQQVKGRSPVQSGIDNIPTVLALVTASIASGAMISKTGHYAPFLFASTVFASVGSGLITTFKVHTGHPAWIGYQVLYGLGLGWGMQLPMLATQAVLEQEDIAVGMAIMGLFQQLGGGVWVTVSQILYNNYLKTHLPEVAGISPSEVFRLGATQVLEMVPHDVLEAVLAVYNAALHKAFILPLALACAMIVPSLGVEWLNLKRVNEQREKEKEIANGREQVQEKGATTQPVATEEA